MGGHHGGKKDCDKEEKNVRPVSEFGKKDQKIRAWPHLCGSARNGKLILLRGLGLLREKSGGIRGHATLLLQRVNNSG